MRQAGFDRSLFWTLTFAVFAAVAAGLASRAADRLASGYETERTSFAIVRVLAPEGAEAMSAAEAALRDAPHVGGAEAMTAGRAAAVLRQWSGGDVRAQDLPPLRLIEIELDPNRDPAADVNGDIVAALAQAGVTAEVIAAPDAASGGGASSQIRSAALWGAVGFAAIMTLIIALAARGLAARRRELVTVMTDLGATKAQAAGKIGAEAASMGLAAGLLGAILAGAAAIAVLWVAFPEMNVEALRDMILPLDLAPMVAAPFVAAFAATAGARAAAIQFHRHAARLG